MSLRNFIHHLLASIADIFNGLPSSAKTGVAIGNKVVDNLKNHEGDIQAVKDIIPGDLDNKIIDAIEAAIPKIVTDLQLVASLQGEKDPVKILNAAKAILLSLAGNTVQYDFYDSLATQIGVVATTAIHDGAQVWADTKALWNDIKTVMKWFNDHNKTKLPGS